MQVPTHFHRCSNVYPAAFPGIRSFPTAWWKIFSAFVLMPNEIVRLSEFSHLCNPIARKFFDSKLEYGLSKVNSQQSRAVSKCWICCVCCGFGKQIPMLLQSFFTSLLSSTILINLAFKSLFGIAATVAIPEAATIFVSISICGWYWQFCFFLHDIKPMCSKDCLPRA